VFLDDNKHKFKHKLPENGAGIKNESSGFGLILIYRRFDKVFHYHLQNPACQGGALGKLDPEDGGSRFFRKVGN